MNPDGKLGSLKAKWQELLDKSGHNIRQKRTSPDVISSRNGFRKKYRWILMTSENARRTFTKFEQSHIRHNLKQAQAQLETAYLVVGFVEEPRKIIVIPAKTALNASFVRSDKGGITWDN